MEDVIVNVGVNVFGIEEQAVDVEDAGADRWERGRGGHREVGIGGLIPVWTY